MKLFLAFTFLAIFLLAEFVEPKPGGTENLLFPRETMLVRSVINVEGRYLNHLFFKTTYSTCYIIATTCNYSCCAFFTYIFVLNCGSS